MARKGAITLDDTSAEIGPPAGGRDFTLQNTGAVDAHFDYAGNAAVFGEGLRLSPGEDISSTELPGYWKIGPLTGVSSVATTTVLYHF